MRALADMSPRHLVLLMCAFLGLTLLGLHGFAALLPFFIVEWGMSNTAAGWVNGAPYLAYVLVIPFLSITDRIDARRLLIWGSAFGAVGFFGFALFADGLWSALLFRALQGIGFAGTYMPGVKAIADRIEGPERARATSYYVSSFAICSSFSVVIAAEMAGAFGWRWAFVLPGIGYLAAMALILALLPPVAVRPTRRAALLDYRPVLRNRRVVGFVIGAFTHSVELLGMRGWTVAFLTYAVAVQGLDGLEWGIAAVATALILIGAPTSFMGGEAGHRWGFARAATVTMLLSAVAASVVGFSAAWPVWLFLAAVLAHNLFVLADSGTLNGGAIATSDADYRGATVALYAFANAIGGLIGPVMFGAVLDLTGGGTTPESWGWAFASLGATVALGALATMALGGRR